MTLTSKQRSNYRSQAHKLKPVVIIGSNGVTDAVIAEINRALNDHELIKVKIASQDREQRKADAFTICEALSAELIQNIGNISVIYRKNPE
ncbi:MAG: ribosome assembly RNA-binding protein YhbY [Legionellales bacterium]|nr:ribosome assembly RNA-binding protein YhbY [Legionellales bacterium]|tara:strand:- start:684 stop:956 length:273 start_codon:yes stop_codon:yes gene_type:complete